MTSRRLTSRRLSGPLLALVVIGLVLPSASADAGILPRLRAINPPATDVTASGQLRACSSALEVPRAGDPCVWSSGEYSWIAYSDGSVRYL